MKLWQIIFMLVILWGVYQRWQASRRARPDEDDFAPPSADEKAAHRARLDRMARHREELFESPALRPEAPRPAAAAPAQPAPVARPAPAAAPKEDVTVVLRKQVPPRDAPPRSWFGGLPMMPDHVEWPRGVNDEDRNSGEVPLHFVCQIALEDMPANLWGGHGPRTGWLLFFCNINSSQIEERGVQRLVYTTELGSVRQPPADIRPISDGTYTGGSGWTGRETTYPFVPVDPIAMPNRLYEYDDWKHASPEGLAQLLNQGAVVGDNGPFRAITQPFSWRCVTIALDRYLASNDDVHANERAERYLEEMRADLREPGTLQRIVESKQANLDQIREKLSEGPADDPVASELHARQQGYLATRQGEAAAIAALIARHDTPDSLLDELDKRTPELWRKSVRNGLVTLRTFAEQAGLDTPLTPDQWAEILAELGSVDADIIALARGSRREGLKVTLDVRRMRLADLIAGPMCDACGDVARLYYFDPARRDLLPADARPALEAHLRSLDDNRPQRLGGYHDGVQSSPDDAVPGEMLLLQLACDYALDMIWGDCGAVYAWIKPADLDACRFEEATVTLECH